MRMVKFPSIEAFNTTVKNLRMHFQYDGKDVDGKTIYNTTKELPTLSFRGEVKLHGCFEKNTLIMLSNGEKEKISDIQVGTYILSYDEQNDKFTNNKVLNVFNRKLDKQWVKLHFDNGTTLSCTADHKIFTKNRGYVEASSLKENDVLISC